jgi:hypothetical protein
LSGFGGRAGPRQPRERLQEELARTLEVEQAAVTKLEQSWR